MYALKQSHLEVSPDGVQAMQVIVEGDSILVQHHMGVQDSVPVGQVMPAQCLIEGLAGAQQALLL